MLPGVRLPVVEVHRAHRCVRHELGGHGDLACVPGEAGHDTGPDVPIISGVNLPMPFPVFLPPFQVLDKRPSNSNTVHLRFQVIPQQFIKSIFIGVHYHNG